MMAATTLTVTPPRWSWRPTRRSFSRQMHPRLREMVVSLGAIGLLKSFRVVKRHSWMDEQDVVRTNVNFLDQFLQKGGSVLAAFADSFAPLYFAVRELKEVMSIEQPCDLAYEFGDGLHDIEELPLGFPRPVEHPYPFNDQIVVYVRYLGPGVSVGQAWQEGTKLEQVPHKLYGEILMVKDCTSLREDQ
ncbi:hypothetical protein JHK82_022090 [Glycine max]|nr:hypothetical protein JHK85_022568 [Glycine max]KAG5137359.1 hypothetical protein JHK82_022090 [Glycine max]